MGWPVGKALAAARAASARGARRGGAVHTTFCILGRKHAVESKLKLLRGASDGRTRALKRKNRRIGGAVWARRWRGYWGDWAAQMGASAGGPYVADYVKGSQRSL